MPAIGRTHMRAQNGTVCQPERYLRRPNAKPLDETTDWRKVDCMICRKVVDR